MICCKRELNATVHTDTSCDLTELLYVSIPPNSLGTSTNLHIIIAYIPPNKPRELPTRLDDVRQVMSRLIESNLIDNFLLIGDFNLPFIEWSEDNYTLLHQGSIDAQTAAEQLITDLEFYSLKQYT